jgi:hypothetical protein
MAQRMRVHESRGGQPAAAVRASQLRFGGEVGRAQMVLLPAQGMDVAAIAGREGFIVEQLVDEFTWSKPLGDSRSVRQPL